MSKNQTEYPEILKAKLAPKQDAENYCIERQSMLIDIAMQLDNKAVSSAVQAALVELSRAEILYPDNWPAGDPVHAVAIMAEEAGEAVQAANNLKWGHGGRTYTESIAKLRKEIIQTMAMCVRVLKNMPEGVE